MISVYANIPQKRDGSLGIAAGARHKLMSREAKLRANGLLDMLYKPSEIARELGIEKRHIYGRLIPSGMPHNKDRNGSIWIHGPELAAWLRTLTKKRVPLADGEAYCMRCRKPSRIVDSKRVRHGALMLLRGKCNKCGATVNRGVKAR